MWEDGEDLKLKGRGTLVWCYQMLVAYTLWIPALPSSVGGGGLKIMTLTGIATEQYDYAQAMFWMAVTVTQPIMEAFNDVQSPSTGFSAAECQSLPKVSAVRIHCSSCSANLVAASSFWLKSLVGPRPMPLKLR